jgi:hypothetical protein
MDVDHHIGFTIFLFIGFHFFVEPYIYLFLKLSSNKPMKSALNNLLSLIVSYLLFALVPLFIIAQYYELFLGLLVGVFLFVRVYLNKLTFSKYGVIYLGLSWVLGALVLYHPPTHEFKVIVDLSQFNSKPYFCKSLTKNEANDKPKCAVNGFLIHTEAIGEIRFDLSPFRKPILTNARLFNERTLVFEADELMVTISLESDGKK